MTILVVGLGNPGSTYAGNRHNIGFMAADLIVRRHSFGPWRKKFQGEYTEGSVDGQKVLVLKPATYMNLSGNAVAECAKFYKIPVQDIIVLHDELDIAPGKLRIKRGGGAGGHNGLKSIDSHLGQNYRRVRLGIGHPGDKNLVSGYVLHDFAKAEEVWLTPMLDAVADNIGMLLAGDEAGYQNKVALAVNPPRPKAPKPQATDATAPLNVSNKISPPAPAATPDNAIAAALKAAMEKKKG